ncbi:S-adenosyl-L-methionine-dependent tRNA 4-demethylwyosine synthase-like [Oopsacas minuta]|uniref:S-adenosyl-L-methionine-dependent tRNA 4-demethylwyosine synthase TYW1 n=1 Tax=Oopsacas minuta TaxID=111878 RepID=A0AAV7JLX6_9METZ|nr:S-adenosyl-L-methionine-dependent tRNA 4-demethylwyosine synthase-like [Oopsacas minuta]
MSKYVNPELRKLIHSKEQAQKRGNFSEEAKFCNVIGEFYKKEGNLAGALKEHEMELQLCESIGDRLGVAIANRRVGECKSEIGQFEEGLRHHKLYLRIAKSLGNLKEEQRALATIGRNCYLYALSLPEPDSSKQLEYSKDAILESLKCCDKLEANKNANDKDVLEMKARLFSNLSNYYEQKGNLILAKKYCQKAILLSKSHKFCCASFYFSLGSIYLSCKDYTDALRQFELAFRQADSDSDKPMCSYALEQMGVVFAILRDFNSAKYSWKRALKTGAITGEEKVSLQGNYMLIKKLITYIERLPMIHKEDYKHRIELLEKLGDTACKLDLFSIGVGYYEEELELAEKNGYTKISEICCSIAVTYADLKQYDKAVIYYERELECYGDWNKNKCNSLRALGDAHYEAGHHYLVIDDVYEKARLEGEESGNQKALVRVWKSLLRLYEREGRHQQVMLAKMAIDDLSTALSDSSESSDSGDEEEEFNLSESDISEDELEDLQEGTTAVSRVRRAKKTNLHKVNAKGETKLHQAAIQGRVHMAKILLKQGAIVNTHDYCGWSPLHEACNFGNTEMALLLLEYGANVNDPGGEHCHGITPLHDAVQNEHYSCVKLLIEFGANPFLRYKNNETVIDIAKELVSEAEDLNCSNKEMDKINKIFNLLLACKVENHKPNPLNLNPFHKKCRSTREDSPPPLLPVTSSPVNTQPWLVEDMGYRNKRTRMSPKAKSKPTSSHDNLSPYKVISPRKQTPKKKAVKQKKTVEMKSSKKLKLSYSPSDIIDPNLSSISLEDYHSCDSFTFFGANVANTPTPLTNFPIIPVPEYKIAHSSPDHLSEPTSANSMFIRTENMSIQEVKRVKVTIENDLIKIPCLPNKTIQWLCEEASKRYSSLRGIKPLLQLTDKDGALLMAMDSISAILTNDEEIIGRVESWDLPSLRDRYQQYCTTQGVTVYERLLGLLPDLAIENELNLSNKMIPSVELGHLFKCLSAQGHLTKLDLSSNKIGDECMKILATSLRNLNTLQCLILGCCNISCKGVTAILTQIVTQQTANKPLNNLMHLDMSFNFICGDGGRALSQFLTHMPNLVFLKLESCGLDICTDFSLLSRSICELRSLKDLSLIFNKISESDINILLQSLSNQNMLEKIIFHPYSLVLIASAVLVYVIANFVKNRSSPAPPVSLPVPTTPRTMVIAYGTQTGTSRTLANNLAAICRRDNISHRVSSLSTKECPNPDDFLLQCVSDESLLVIILSTYEEGMPPDEVKWFYTWLQDASQDHRVSRIFLQRLHYCVFGIGHSVYGLDRFCTAGRQIDEWLASLSAKRLLPFNTGDQDVTASLYGGVEQDFNVWSIQLLRACMPLLNTKSTVLEGFDESVFESKLSHKTKPVPAVEDIYESSSSSDSEPDIADLEDMGDSIENSIKPKTTSKEPRAMLTPLLRQSLTKQGYKLVGTHSGVKLCRWTKSMLRGRGGCYKHTFYGIESHRCMETTPSLACANKCVFCWRHHTNPVGTEWKWLMDPPDLVIDGAIENHHKLINQYKGVPGVKSDRLAEAMAIRHCALSLVGEPIMYPEINAFIGMLHERRISSFLVTNAQFPELIHNLTPVTQLYVSVDAASEGSLKLIDRPLFRDFWPRFVDSLRALSDKGQRTVYRLTLVKEWNSEEIQGYAKLVSLGKPDFIEIKGVTFCGNSDASSLTMKNVPWHEEVIGFSRLLAEYLPDYDLACEHEHSNCILIAHRKFFIDGEWCTWIDYDRFLDLISKYEVDNVNTHFNSMDYLVVTPAWAVFGNDKRGFDPDEQRVSKKRPSKKDNSGC